MDPVTIGLLGVDAVTSAINMRRGNQDMARIEGELGAMGDSANYTLSGDYNQMVNMALNAPQLGVSAAERGFGDQAAMAAQYGSRGIGALGAANRQQVDTLNALEQQRQQNIQGALGTRAGADQAVMNANTAQDIAEFTAERNRLLQEKAAAQDMINAGISGFTNLGGAALSGVAGGLMSSEGFGTGFGQGLESFSNPAGGTGGGGNQTNTLLDLLTRRADGGVVGKYREGGNVQKETVKGDNVLIPAGPEDHDKVEYMITRMVKTADGVKKENLGLGTAGELYQKNLNDGSAQIINSGDLGSIQDGWEDYQRTGRVKNLIKFVGNVFKKPQFKK